eukprot:TRINITY_DN35903_c0_g1_i1.p1 TRINITY_DN35903_c0_g1~~TRINITY_DN35903_c0_g1_i1.p1  ORF type:complete len:302 (+),score=83.22 TRINITY_DN35903_c0_g1_i1:74-907(+)
MGVSNHPDGSVSVDLQISASFRGLAFPTYTALRAFASARWAVLKEGWLGIAEARESGMPVYVVSQRLVVSDDLASAPRDLVDGMPATCTLQIVKVGNSSFTMMSKLEVPSSTEKTLTATNVVTYVFVDAATRKSRKIPDEVLAKLREAVAPEGSVTVPEPGKVMDFKDATVNTYSMSVRPSDTDWNGHVNQSQYLAFVCDALESVHRKEPAVVHASITYVKEMHVGHDLSVSWAADPQEEARVSFKLAGADGTLHALGVFRLAECPGVGGNGQVSMH